MTFTREELTSLHKLLVKLSKDATTRDLAQPLRAVKVKIAKALIAMGKPDANT